MTVLFLSCIEYQTAALPLSNPLPLFCITHAFSLSTVSSSSPSSSLSSRMTAPCSPLHSTFASGDSRSCASPAIGLSRLL